MKYVILVGFAFVAVVVFIIWKEFPFDAFIEKLDQNETDLEVPTVTNIVQADVTTMAAIVNEVVEKLMYLDEEMNEMVPDGNFTWNQEVSPFLSAFRNFWTQARVSLTDPIDPLSLEPINEPIFKAIEHGLIEATTMLMSQTEVTSFSTDSSTTVDSIKRSGDILPEPEELVNLNLNTKNNRQTAFDLMANMSTSCSNCYENLQSCVQQCFVDHNCNDIQRGVRTCPSIPNRLCNPFTQWNPVDECKTHSDCKSPLLCCNDGCINKCLPGVWQS